MVTKKTRLLSAIMAVMMLVTMLTGIVLPAVAVTTKPAMTTLTEYHAANNTTKAALIANTAFEVSSLAELELLSYYQNDFTENHTIYITADITIPEDYTNGSASGVTSSILGYMRATGKTQASKTTTYYEPVYKGSVNYMCNLIATLDGRYAEGGMAKISGINTSFNWLGIYSTGKGLYNLHFDDCHASAIGNGGALIFGANDSAVEKTFENITMTNCSAAKETGSNNIGLFCSKTNGAAATFRNIRVEDCSLIDNTNYTSGPCNLGFLVAATKYSVTLENIVMIDNTIDIDWLDNSHGVIIGEMTQDSADVFARAKNVAVIGTELNINNEGEYGGSVGAYGMNSTLGAVIGAAFGYTKKTDGPAITLENILVYGNDKGTHTYNSVVSGGAVAAAGGNILVKATNVSTDLPKIVRDTIHDEQSTGSSYKSVYVQELTADSANNTVNDTSSLIEAACKLNEASAEKAWGIRDGKIDFIKDDEKAAKKVTVEIRNPVDNSPVGSYVDYTGVDGKLIGTDQYADEAALWTEDPATAVIAGNVVTGYVVPAHTCEWDATDNGNGTHSYVCGCEWPVTGVGTVRCPESGEGTCDQNGWASLTSADTEEPDANHQVVVACSVCGHKFAEFGQFDCTGELKQNSYVPATSCKPEGAGSVVTGCTVCDYTHTGVVLGEELHQWDAYIERQDLPKYHEISCSICGKASGELEKHDDKFGDWQVTTPSDVDNEGVETRTCVCGKIETRPVAKLPGIKLEAEKAKVGNTFEVKVNLKNNPGVGGMKLELTYDADLVSLVGTADSDWDIVFDSNVPANTSGVVTKNIHVVASEDMTGDGTMLVLTFEVKNDEELTNTESAIKVKVGDAYNYDFELVEFEEFTHSFVIFTGLVKGDISGDKFVNIQDAIYLLRYLGRPEGNTSYEVVPGVIVTDKMANLTTENDNIDPGDGTNTGDVNISDVIYLLKYLNFQITDAEFFGE